jgi:hypothetical protein
MIRQCRIIGSYRKIALSELRPPLVVCTLSHRQKLCSLVVCTLALHQKLCRLVVCTLYTLPPFEAVKTAYSFASTSPRAVKKGGTLLLSCSVYPFPTVLSWLSCLGCPVPAVTFPAVLLGSAVLIVMSQLPRLSLSGCP